MTIKRADGKYHEWAEHPAEIAAGPSEALVSGFLRDLREKIYRTPQAKRLMVEMAVADWKRTLHNLYVTAHPTGHSEMKGHDCPFIWTKADETLARKTAILGR